MKSRILVAVVGVPVLVYVVLWGPALLMAAALCALAGVAGWELQNCVGGGKGSSVSGAVFPVLTVSWYFVRPADISLLFTAVTVTIFACAVARGGEVRFEEIAAQLFSGICVGYAFSTFLRMYAWGVRRTWLLLPFILSFACDTFAFFFGRAFGRHKLAPKVSPHKTVEGAVGGLLGNLLCGLLFAFIMDRSFGEGIGFGAAAALSLLCGVAAQIGDLSFSLIKRQYGVKDYGRLFLEHGGVLDRFDSVLFVAPVLEIVLRLAGVG